MNMTSSQPYWGPILFVSSFNMEYDESVTFYASSQRIFFFNLDPTLNSHKSGSKNYRNKKTPHFQKALDVSFPMTYTGYLQSEKKRVCVCIVLVLFEFWTISTGNKWEITEISRLSCFSDFFVCFHIIVCVRYTADNAHFIFFRHHLTTFTFMGLAD